MDWANEKYVRLFVRDTVTWKMLPWQSRALLPLILRKLDRSGVLDLGEYGEGAIAAITEVPVDFVEAGLPALLKARVFALADGRLSMPNYLPAQETRQSDAQRKRDSRERRATGGDIDGRPTDKPSPAVTRGHQVSPEVTPTPDLPQTYPKTEPSRAPAPVATTGPIRPRTAHELELCLRVEIERSQPEAGRWIPGRFSYRDAEKLLHDLGDIEAALPELERKIDTFAKDPDMQPWSMAKFCDKYVAIGLPKLEFGRAPKKSEAPTQTPVLG